MKKLLGFILILFVVLAPKALALDVKTAEASLDSNGTLTVKGTTPSEMMAVSINIYEEDGTTLVAVRSTQVNDDDTFEFTEKFEAKKYVVKVADYEGGNTIDIAVEPNGETATSKNAKTGDFIHIYVIAGIVALIGIFGTAFYLKKIK